MELENDRIITYLNAFRDIIQPGVTKMVLCVLSTQRKDCYDALKVHLCITTPGYWKLSICHCLLVGGVA